MSRIFITGSADGLGLMAAQLLIAQGHKVMLHARNTERAALALQKAAGAENVLVADLSDMEATKRLAEEANKSGTFDAVIHNAGVYRVSNPVTFTVNSVAPYILTCMMNRPRRLIYLSSGLHMHGKPEINTKAFKEGQYNYSDTKLHVILLAKAIFRKWPEILANAVNPGWVPTKMGGAGAPDDLQKGVETQAWLAVSDEKEAKVSGRYFFHKKEKYYNPAADNVELQEKFVELCREITGVYVD
jgi:NAD(P)-dependent dehydrogenase (short-subunit alcohol dehydrogenase family)